MNILKIGAIAALFAGGATLALAQTTTPAPSTTEKDSPSKAQPGAPTQGPGKELPGASSGSRPIGPPANPVEPAPGKNPAGVTMEKQKSEQNAPDTGGKKN
jgi:hypothetical protein